MALTDHSLRYDCKDYLLNLDTFTEMSIMFKFMDSKTMKHDNNYVCFSTVNKTEA